MASKLFKFFTLLLVASFGLPIHAASEKHELLMIHDGPNYGWEVIESDVADKPDEWQIRDVCSRGMWLTYDGVNYTNINDDPHQFFYVEGTCYTFGGSIITVRSARRVGDFEDNSIPWASLFTKVNYQGDMVVTTDTNALPNIDFQIMSLVTSNANIEFYKEPNFQGDSYCLNAQHQVRHVKEKDWSEDNVCRKAPSGGYRFPDLTDVDHFPVPWNWDISTAKSVKVGCTGEHAQLPVEGLLTKTSFEFVAKTRYSTERIH